MVDVVVSSTVLALGAAMNGTELSFQLDAARIGVVLSTLHISGSKVS
jgi:hypothetical protein